jgi:hypothetical protein
MTPHALLATCTQAGVILKWDGSNIKAYGDVRAISNLLPILKRHKADLHAYFEAHSLERNLSLWLVNHPPTQADAAICPHCRKPNGEIGRDTIVTGDGIWLHRVCHAEWLKQLRQQAIIEMHTNQTKH